MAQGFDGIIRIRENPIGRYERFALALKPREFEGGQGFSDYRHEHRAEGGFYRCDFDIHGELNDLLDFVRNGLARSVCVFDPSGVEVLWEGLIWELELDIDSAKIKNSMDNLWNSVYLRYRLPGTGTTLRSVTARDATSVRRYGLKEQVLSGGEIETAVANQVAQAYLALHKNPKPYPASIDIGEATNQGAVLHVACRGLAETWDLRRYNQTTLTGNVSASAFVQAVLGQPNLLKNLVAWWDFEETGATDERLDSRASYNLMPVNGPTGAAGKVGNAAYLVRASTQYFHLDENETDEFAVRPWMPFTVKAWVYLASKPGGIMSICQKWRSAAPASRYWLLRWYSVPDRFQFNVWDAAGIARTLSANTFGAPALNTWYLVIARYDPALTTAYISVNAGTEDSLFVPGGRCEAEVGAATRLAQLGIGGRYGADAWDGRIDSLAFAQRCWTAAERTWVFNSNAGRNFDALSYLQYIRSARIQGNSTQVSQVSDMDRKPGDIIRDVARLGDPNFRRWIPYMDTDAEFVYEETARPSFQVV